MEALSFLMSPTTWIVTSILFFILNAVMAIIIYLLFKQTHIAVELKAHMTDTPIGMFFMDNKFVDWRPVTPINGIVYDKKYGPFIVGQSYISKKTKNIILPFDVDMDGDRTTNVPSIAEQFRNISNNQKSISLLRAGISSGNMIYDNKDADKDAEYKKNIFNLTSHIKFGNMKQTLRSIVPHNIKSKIEKIISDRMVKYGKIDVMQAVIIFGALFGIIVIGSIIVKMTVKK